MSVDEHEEWPEISMEGFESFLKTCWDYRKDGFGRFEFRHNHEIFAVLFDGGRRVRFNPNYLVT